MLDGLVDQPLVFTLKDLRRFPSVTRIHFIECAGNSGREHAGHPGENAQRSHGLLSNTEWSGVLLKTILAEVGIKPTARWVVAEGADASKLSRSLPLEKALDDAIVAYREALALDPQLADAHFNLARLYEKATDAMASFRHLLAYRRLIDRQGT